MTYLEIADYIENEISMGKYHFDDLLPSTTELAKQFGVTGPTIQKSMSRLVKKGLIYRVPKRGSFVRRNTTAGGRLAIILGRNPFTSESRFPGFLLTSLEKYTLEHHIPAKVYYCLNETLLSDMLNSLEKDAKEVGIKCAVAVHTIHPLNVYLRSQNLFPAIWNPKFDYSIIIRQGIVNLKKNGCKRILILTAKSPYDKYEFGRSDLWAAVREGCQECQLPEKMCRVELIEGLKHGGYSAIKAIFENKKQEWPDGILALDDVLAQGALFALMELGVKIPQHVRFITQITKGERLLSPVKLATFACDPDRLTNVLMEKIYSPRNEIKLGINEDVIWIDPTFVPGESI